MSRNQPEYDHWLNRWETDPELRVRVYDRLFFAGIGFLAGWGLALLLGVV